VKYLTLRSLVLLVAALALVACGGKTIDRADAAVDAPDVVADVADAHAEAAEPHDAPPEADAGDTPPVPDGEDVRAETAEPVDAADETRADAPDATTDERAAEAEPAEAVEVDDPAGPEAADVPPDLPADVTPGDVTPADLSDTATDAGDADDVATPEVPDDTGGVPVGVPCAADDECGDGHCVWTAEGRACSTGCTTDADCPLLEACRNVSTGGPKVGACVDRHLGLCRPCRTDADCVAHAYASGARCVALDPAEGSFCRTVCGSGVACPSGYVCASPGTAGATSVCVPDEGECPCDGGAIAFGLSTDCALATPAGVCHGTRACGAEGLSACDARVPVTEACNGADDDCDGATDEGFGVVTCGEGACRASIDECADGIAGTCVPGPATTEACNGADDDCDGATDEELGELTCGQGVCSVRVPACADGVPLQCEPGQGGSETCNGADDDCDGATDEGFGSASCGVGICATSVSTCVDGAPQPCVPLPLGGVETCDGLDDDCDGTTDEELGALECGQGACARSVPACVDGVPQACVPGEGAVEACNGADDDCDGVTDEGFPSLTCGEGACRVTVTACSGGNPSDCQPLPAHAESCNGQDDDCDGQTDEDLGSASCGQGACHVTIEACRNGVTQTCSPLPPSSAEACNGVDDDCDGATDEELGTLACGAGACATSVTACVGGVPQACVPRLPVSEACNGVDDDCDGATDEGLGNTSCGLGACATSVVACKAGVPQTCTPLAVSKAETCNAVDDDCDGSTDEGLGTLSCGKGVCATTVDACRNGVTQTCTPLPLGVPEKCNAVDDDCDGATDEELGTVSCGLGVCAATVAGCTNGVAPTCTPNWAAQTAEACNALDDDCDGATDEGMGGSWCVRYAVIDAASPALTDAALVSALHALVTDGSVSFPYTGSNNARLKMYDPDNGIEADADSRVECIYTARTAYIPPGTTTNYSALGTCTLSSGAVCPTCDTAPTESKCGFNTEHAWPRSLLKVVLGDGTADYVKAEGDMHHLFPAWYQANSHRSDNLYGDTACIPGDGSCNWPDAFEGYEPSCLGSPSSPGYVESYVFEVRPERRGDVARAWFYMSVRYGLPIVDYVEAVLRTWHQSDLPDQRELDRNAGVDAFQHNRNPFVDRPAYVARISNF
jgi:endonuclease I